jgi:hypothetical protein
VLKNPNHHHQLQKNQKNPKGYKLESIPKTNLCHNLKPAQKHEKLNKNEVGM